MSVLTFDLDMAKLYVQFFDKSFDNKLLAQFAASLKCWFITMFVVEALLATTLVSNQL